MNDPIQAFYAQERALQQRTFAYQDTFQVVVRHEPLSSIKLYAVSEWRFDRAIQAELLSRFADSSVFKLVLDDPQWNSGPFRLQANLREGMRSDKEYLSLDYIGLPRRLEAFLVLTKQRIHRLVPGDTSISRPVPLVNRMAVSSTQRWVQLWDSTSTMRLQDADDLSFLASGNWNSPGRRLGMARKMQRRITTLGLPGSFLQWDTGPRQINRQDVGDTTQVYSFSAGPDFLCFLSRRNGSGSSRLHAMRSSLLGVFHQRMLGTGRYHLAEMNGLGPGLLEQANGQSTLYHYQPLQQRLVPGRSASLPVIDRVKPALGGILCAAGEALYYFSYQQGSSLLANGVVDFAFNPEDQRVYFLQRDGIYSVALTGGTPQQEMPFSGNVRALALLFNKG